MQFDQILKKYYIFYVLFGTVITIIVLLIKSTKIKVSPKRILWAIGHLFIDVFKAFPPVFRTLIAVIIVIFGIALFSKNNKPDIQLPQAPAPAPARAPGKPVEVPAPLQEFPYNVPVPKAPLPAPPPEPVPVPVPKSPVYTPVPEHKPVLPPTFIPTPKKPPTPETQETISRYLKLGNTLTDGENPDYDKAIEMFKRVLVIDSDNEEAIRGIEEAKKAKVAELYPNSKEAELAKKKLKEIVNKKNSSMIENLETYKGHIYVNSDPPSANIYIDGTYKADTPAELSLLPGEYMVMFIRKNYKVETIPLNIKKGINLPLSVRLSPD